MSHSENAAPGLRERKKRRTRQAIAAAALRLFAEHGYEETTIADIAAAADISPRTFFSYFPSKEDVVFAEIDDRIAEARARLAELPPDETPLESVRRISLEVLEAATADNGVYEAALVQIILDRPGLQARALMRFYDFEQETATHLRTYCPNLDEAIAAVIGGMIVGSIRATIIYCREQAYGPQRTQEAIESALSVIENGLRSIPALTWST